MSIFPSPRFLSTALGAVSAIALLAGCQGMEAMSGGGAVYALTNKTDANSVAAFRAGSDGSISAIAEYPTGGRGGRFDEMDGLDSLISEDSVLNVDDRWLLAVNPGSDTITVFRINPDFSLTSVSTAPSGGHGPNSLAYSNGLVYVANVDSDGQFMGPPDQSGNVMGLRLNADTGALSPIAGSMRQLGARPSDVEFTTDGRHLVISAVNAGSSKLAGGSDAEMMAFAVQDNGMLGARPTGTAASTLAGNATGRNLPTAIGFEIVERGGAQVVIVTEAREFLPNGDPGMPPMFQTGSVSTWRLGADGGFMPASIDVLTGPAVMGGPTSACWLVVSEDGETVFVTNASAAVISTYRLGDDGRIRLTESRAASGAPAMPNAPDPLANADGFIDIARSADGRYIYQLLGLRGQINVYRVGSDGRSLAPLQPSSGLLPMKNTQGLVFVGGR